MASVSMRQMLESGCSFRTSRPALEPEDGALHFGERNKDPYHHLEKTAPPIC